VEANRSLRRLAAVDCDLSGSTGIAAVVTAGNKLVVANLGDSRCVAGELPACAPPA
jgi:serine/threonine protein phosphatase PrpC